jgi:hypothetical protein
VHLGFGKETSEHAGFGWNLSTSGIAISGKTIVDSADTVHLAVHSAAGPIPLVGTVRWKRTGNLFVPETSDDAFYEIGLTLEAAPNGYASLVQRIADAFRERRAAPRLKTRLSTVLAADSVKTLHYALELAANSVFVATRAMLAPHAAVQLEIVLGEDRRRLSVVAEVVRGVNKELARANNVNPGLALVFRRFLGDGEVALAEYLRAREAFLRG